VIQLGGARLQLIPIGIVFNEDGSYVRFAKTPNGMYCINIKADGDNHVVLAHQKIKGESAHFSAQSIVEEQLRSGTYRKHLPALAIMILLMQ
jgi:hypothetical protein